MKLYAEKYKWTFRYLSLDMSRNEISKLLKTSRNTIRKVENATKSLRLSWNDVSTMTSEEFAVWKQATGQYNYHISIDKMYYSVPYEYIKHKVDVRITRSIIEVYYKKKRICSHRRLYGNPGQYSTNMDHMPLNHKKAGEWNGDRFRKLADSYSSKQLEEACHMALQHLAVPRYKNIKLIIAHNQDIRKTEDEQVIDDSYATIRGSSYYGGSNN